MYSNVVMEIEHFQFDNILEREKEREGVAYDYELSADGLRKVIEAYKKLVRCV